MPPITFDRVALLILDGWGHGAIPSASAIAQAKTPFINQLYESCPNAELTTFGEAVGLPEGQMGNSEVGHLNIGAGRVVYQDLALINRMIREGKFEQNEALQTAIAIALQNNKPLHIMGLVSDGGVHSHIDHAIAVGKAAEAAGLEKIYFHAFTDGRDCDPKSGATHLETLLSAFKDGNVKLASICGRYYAMDRDQRWERVMEAYNLLTQGKGIPIGDVPAAVRAAYEEGLTDEFLLPMVVMLEGKPTAIVEEGDVVICFNFRTDRCRELVTVLTQKAFPEHGMKPLPLHLVTMTRYDEKFEGIEVMYEKDDLKDTLGENLSKAGKTQLRVAETEKYPHVTFFFNGGQEAPFAGEHRIIVPSAKVATYDLQPEMSAAEITRQTITFVEEHQPSFVCLNYANTDMVGHTGVFAAAIKAAETVDGCLEQLVPRLLEKNYAVLIIADHGNSDLMINPDGSPNTSHTVNPVPCILVTPQTMNIKIEDGALCDIAPTILDLLGMEAPAAMTGKSLIHVKVE